MKGDGITKAMNVSSIDADLFDAVVRLVRLVECLASAKSLLSDLKASGLFEDVKAELVHTGQDTRKLLLTCAYWTLGGLAGRASKVS
jgi:hypothetical protein